jgi:TonB family protein
MKVMMGWIALCLFMPGPAPAQSKPDAVPGQVVSFDKWLNEEVGYIISEKEKDVFLKLKTDKERQVFVEAFWKQRDPNPATPDNEMKTEHYRRLAYANEHYAEGATPGWKTESGRYYIIFGDTLKPAGWRMKMSVIEGVRAGAAEPPKAVTSSSLSYGLTATLKTEVGLAEALKQIERTFNFGSARMLTEADFQWRTAKPEKDFHIFRLDGKEYAVFVTPLDLVRKLSFRLEVYEQGEKGKTNLLDTEFAAQEKTTTVFGFEDSKGTSYFLAFQMLGWLGETMVDGKLVQLPMAGQPPLGAGGEPVRIMGELKPPRLIKLVDPVYPEVAKKARVEGMVILEATTDSDGKVINTRILRSIPLLDQAANDAVRQWLYEPMLIKGKPYGVVFTVTVRFTLDGAKAGVAGGVEGGRLERVLPVERPSQVVGGVVGGAKPVVGVVVGSEGPPPVIPIAAAGAEPKLVKKVDPVYPEKARQARVEGVVIVEATINPSGHVTNTRILRSIPLLDQAATAAVKQWIYEPAVVDGKPIAVSFTVTVRFKLDEKTKGEVIWKNDAAAGGVVGGVAGTEGGKLEPVRATGDIQPPKLLTQVDAKYPEEARSAKVEGTVILEVETDVYGRVANIKVLRSIPILDQAVIDAVRQWVYEPMIINGKPRGCIFTVTVRFTLK